MKDDIAMFPRKCEYTGDGDENMKDFGNWIVKVNFDRETADFEL